MLIIIFINPNNQKLFFIRKGNLRRFSEKAVDISEKFDTIKGAPQ
jgi:hypothetical protein